MKSFIKIGRDNTNDIIINEPRVSRNHATVTILENGGYEVKDLGSSNGTFVNGQKIVKQVIYPGDQLQIASSIVDWQAAFQAQASIKGGSEIHEDAYAPVNKTITIGSSGDNDIVIDNHYVSAHHGKIHLLKNGSYFFRDMGSSNGSFVNGAKVIAKNFSRTDVVRLADVDLPNHWFKHKKLQTGFYRDNKRTVWLFLSFVLIIATSTLFYLNRCNWFSWGCNLSPQQMYTNNRNTLVHIEHEYFYTILRNDKKYFVGKNKNFPEQTDANTSKQNLLPYDQVSGNGCFIKQDGSILTSPTITNPWLDEAQQREMLQAVVESKTIPGLTMKSEVTICGETVKLQWIQNNVINNQQNYFEANAINECQFTDSITAIIRSVKKELPAKAGIVSYSFDERTDERMHNTAEKYYGFFASLKNNELVKDSFYATKDAFNINRLSIIPLAESLPGMSEGSAVFNRRGELIGIVQQQQVHLLNRFIKQIEK